MPNFPSIYLELQELWKRLKSSTNYLEQRIIALENDISDGVNPSGPAGGILRGYYPNPSSLHGYGEENILQIDSDKVTVTGSVYFNSNITVNGTASIEMLNTIQQQSLQIGDKFITILTGASDHQTLDGSGILYGSGSTDETTDENGAAAHVVYRGSGENDHIEIYPGLAVSGSVSITSNVTMSGLQSQDYDNYVVINDNGILAKRSLSSNLPSSGIIVYDYSQSGHTFQIPVGAKFVKITCIGAGGRGGGGYRYSLLKQVGTGGGGGGFSETMINTNNLTTEQRTLFIYPGKGTP
jgi:hypothetical protein